MLFKKIIPVFLICLAAQGVAFALSDGGNFLIVPTSEVLGDKAFQVRGTAGYYPSACSGDRPNMCDRHPFVSSFRFGLLNSLDFGVQFGRTVSLDVKDQINKAFGVVPAFALGARALVESPEAYYYSVPKSERKGQTGEFYAVAEWGSNWWKLLGGISAFPTMEADAIAPFWGFEQSIGTQKFGLVYEGFFRHGFSHHNAGVFVRYSKSLQINAGASEFYRYFFNEDGDFGFRIKNPDAGTGYRAPGVYLSVAINGGFTEDIQTQKTEMDSLKKQLVVHEKDLAFMRARVDHLEELYYRNEHIDGSGYLNLQAGFAEIVNGYKADDFNPDSLTVKEQVFMDNGMVARRFIVREAKNKNTAQENRIMAIRMMSHFPDSMFLEPLESIVIDNSDLTVAREAVLTLGAINTPDARKILYSVINKTSGIVRETILEIMDSL